MTKPILIVGVGAVTSVGLTAPQTCAAQRARISGFRDAVPLPPPMEPILGALVPAMRSLKLSPDIWLVNLAVRAVRECLAEAELDTSNTALIIAIPESYRDHPALSLTSTDNFLHRIQMGLGCRLHDSSLVMQSGHASVLLGIKMARDLLTAGMVEYCIVGGVDSLLNRNDIDRLTAASRLYGPENSQGLIPGEGAGFLLLTQESVSRSPQLMVRLLGVGAAVEGDTVLGERYAKGSGLRSALENAVKDAACNESDISFRVSDMNGERYRAWDSMLASTRFYRTRRERMPVWYPASSVGDMGAAAGAITVIVAATSIFRGYAPGPIVMCEASSDEGVRAACVIAPALGAPSPPFRSYEPEW